MNRRERLENKLAKRREWAEKAEQRSRKEWEKSEKAVEGISFGQPILVGHHSEKRHRAAVARAQAAGTRAVEESNLAKHHLEKAAGLSDYLENTIFDDDPDAIEKIEQKIARLEKEHEFMLAVNKICRNRKLNEAEKISAIVALGASEESARKIFAPEYSWQSAGFESWALSNNSANIRRYTERLATMKARRERQAAAENSENGVLIQDRAYDSVSVTFAEKPDYSVIFALKTAGFRWCKGSWYGPKNKLPDEVRKLMKGE